MRRAVLGASALVALAIGVSAFSRQSSVIIVGDSTASPYSLRMMPQTGWGMKLHCKRHVVNKAYPGESTRSFLANRWEGALKAMHPGDAVLIQFGRNDDVGKAGVSTTPEQYARNLHQMIDDVRAEWAEPVLLTPSARLTYVNGELVDDLAPYSAATRRVAIERGVRLIDLNAEQADLMRAIGREEAGKFYMLLRKRPPSDPDLTHFTGAGALAVAGIVANYLPDCSAG